VPASRQITEHDELVDAVAKSYQVAGHEVHPRWQQNGTGLVDVYVPSLRRIEEVETEETFGAIDVERLRALRQRGLEVWVVVPLPLAGAAHQLLRGTADRIQPWWREERGAIRFGQPRIP